MRIIKLMSNPLRVRVMVYASLWDFRNDMEPLRSYVMNHDDPTDRKVLGQQCRNAFEAGQVIVTHPENRECQSAQANMITPAQQPDSQQEPKESSSWSLRGFTGRASVFRRPWKSK